MVVGYGGIDTPPPNTPIAKNTAMNGLLKKLK